MGFRKRNADDDDGRGTTYEVSVPRMVMQGPADEAAQRKLSEYIEKNNPTPEQIASIDPSTL